MSPQPGQGPPSAPGAQGPGRGEGLWPCRVLPACGHVQLTGFKPPSWARAATDAQLRTSPGPSAFPRDERAPTAPPTPEPRAVDRRTARTARSQPSVRLQGVWAALPGGSALRGKAQLHGKQVSAASRSRFRTRAGPAPAGNP